MFAFNYFVIGNVVPGDQENFKAETVPTPLKSVLHITIMSIFAETG